MANKVVKPKHLSNEAGALYTSTVTEFYIDDAVGRMQILTACEALDRLREAQKVVKREGLTVRDRNGIVRPHPASVIEKVSRSAMLAAFRALRLQPPKGK